MNKCIFCGSTEEVSLIPVDSPTNLQPVCTACYEGWRDACISQAMEEEDDLDRTG